MCMKIKRPLLIEVANNFRREKMDDEGDKLIKSL